MVLPFRRKDKDKGQTVNDEDEDINALLDSESQENPRSTEVLPEPTTDEERLHAISDMVVQTCMDIRRGENVLIVCDPTTAEIGQSLHIATQKRSERVLLIVIIAYCLPFLLVFSTEGKDHAHPYTHPY